MKSTKEGTSALGERNISRLIYSAGCFLLILVLIITSVVVLTKSDDNSGNHTEETTATQTQNQVVDSYMIEDFPVLPQVELKAGCEVYACTMLLKYLGFEISESEFAENYLITSPIHYDQYNRYGPDMDSAYAGDVYEGYGINSPAMAKSMNNYLHTVSDTQSACSLKGESLEQLCKQYVAKGLPVMVWATTYMDEPYEKASWVVDYVDENSSMVLGDTETWLQNEHCMVLVGFDKDNYYFADSVCGDISVFAKDVSKERYAQLGMQAIVVR